MATVNLTPGTPLAGVSPTVHATRLPIYYVEQTIDFATAATSKGSALAANDVLQAISVPAQHVVLSAGFEVLTAQTGSGTLTLHLGTTVDADAFAASFDYVAAAVGDYSVKPLAGSEVVFKSAGTVDVTIASLVTANTGGTLRVFALIADVRDQNKPGLAALKS